MVIEGGYLRDILDQPRALEATALSLDVPPALRTVADRMSSGGYERIVLTGMGSSYHALHPLHIGLVGAGFPAVMLETSELITSLSALLKPRTLFVVVSQSGASVEIVRLLDGIPAGGDVVGITNTVGSPLHTRATASVLTHAGLESTVSCKTYATALMALAWLEAVLRNDDLRSSKAELSSASNEAADYLRSWQSHVEILKVELAGVRSLFFVGRGSSLAAAGTAGLTLKESTRLHAEGMSSPAFRHGPFEMLAPDNFVAVFPGTGQTEALNRRLYADILAAGGRAALITRDGNGPFAIPTAPESLRPILEILPVQMISLALASLGGFEAGRFIRASKITLTE